MPQREDPHHVSRRREAVARLRLRGLSIRAIAAALPSLDPPIVNPKTHKPWSKSEIHEDLQTMSAEWRADAARDIAEHQAEQLATLREVQREAWRDKNHDLVLKAHDRIAKILGSNAPERQSVSISGFDDQTVAAAMDKLDKALDKRK